MINAIVGIVIVVISLVILGIAKSKFFVLLGSQVLVVSFVFGNTAKTLFESIIFLFVIHPFDVGDRCEIDGVQVHIDFRLHSFVCVDLHNFFHFMILCYNIA